MKLLAKHNQKRRKLARELKKVREIHKKEYLIGYHEGELRCNKALKDLLNKMKVSKEYPSKTYMALLNENDLEHCTRCNKIIFYFDDVSVLDMELYHTECLQKRD